LEKLLDVFLEETITAEEYSSRKEKLVKQKVGIQEQIRDFEQKYIYNKARTHFTENL